MIWAALVFSVALYIALPQLTEVEVDPEGGWRDLKLPLTAVGLLTVFASFAVRFFITPKLIGEGREQQAFASYVVSLALAESAAIFGLVLAMIGAPFREALLLFAIGFLGLLVQTPAFARPAGQGSP